MWSFNEPQAAVGLEVVSFGQPETLNAMNLAVECQQKFLEVLVDL
jgi:hypothetical protein